MESNKRTARAGGTNNSKSSITKKLTPSNNMTDLVLRQGNEIAITESQKAVHIADAALKQAVTNHSLYQDKLGNGSSSPKGLVMQINKRVKQHFFHSVDELVLLVSLRNAIVRVIVDGESNESLRKEIKQKIYATIEKYGLLIAGLKEVSA